MAGNEIEKLCAKLRDRRVVSQEAEDKAAATIESLQAEVERLRECLTNAVDALEGFKVSPVGGIAKMRPALTATDEKPAQPLKR